MTGGIFPVFPVHRIEVIEKTFTEVFLKIEENHYIYTLGWNAKKTLISSFLKNIHFFIKRKCIEQ